MAVVTVSRKLGSLGDDVCREAAQRLGYSLYTKKDIENRIIELGFPEEKLRKYDEKKIGFLLSLTRGRDEYLNYIKSVIFKKADENNCIIIGRGAFYLLKDLPNSRSFRIVADLPSRIDRISAATGLDVKHTQKKIVANDFKQYNYHKSYFNCNVFSSSMYDAVINTKTLSVSQAADIIVNTVKSSVTPEMEAKGQEITTDLIICHKIVEMLMHVYSIDINSLSATREGKTITLHGVATSSGIVRRALEICKLELSEYEFGTDIKIVQDSMARR